MNFIHAMASGVHKNHVPTCMFFLIAFSQALSIIFVNAERALEGENGDAFECVDMYKQPAFSHPLLKNHTIQRRPSSYPKGLEARNNTKRLLGEAMCPEGTVPIRRTLLAAPRRFGLLGREACKRMCPKGTIPISKTYIINHPKPSPVTKAFNPTAHDSAQVYEQADIYRGDSYHGAHGVLNVWNPKVTGNGEFSSAKIRLSAGTGPNLNSIEVGWHVFPVDQHPRFYVYWTKDNYGKTGCYNLECPGFVQTNNNFFVDDPLYPVSTYGGVQYQTAITIHKDRASGNWWVRKEGEDVGYWPADIFTELGQRAMYISWGGEVFNSGILSNGKHTSTQMGSGHFPGEGNLKAAYLANLGVIDEYADVPREPKNLARFVTKTSCYDVLMGKKGEHGFGTHIYFGGPGYSAQCP